MEHEGAAAATAADTAEGAGADDVGGSTGEEGVVAACECECERGLWADWLRCRGKGSTLCMPPAALNGGG